MKVDFPFTCTCSPWLAGALPFVVFNHELRLMEKFYQGCCWAHNRRENRNRNMIHGLDLKASAEKWCVSPSIHISLCEESHIV